MKKAIFAALSACVLCLPTFAQAKAKKPKPAPKIIKCAQLFDIGLDYPEYEYISGVGDGVRLHFDVTNKSKKSLIAIDGAMLIQVTGVKRPTALSADAIRWNDGLATGETGTFSFLGSYIDMNLVALGSGKYKGGTLAMLYADVLYDDGTVTSCGNHNTLMIPLSDLDL